MTVRAGRKYIKHWLSEIVSMKTEKRYSLLVSGLVLMLITADSLAQKVSAEKDIPESRTFTKNPLEVIRSLYLDDTGEASREVFLRSWGLIPTGINHVIKPYFKASFQKSEVIIKNRKLQLRENARIMNPDFYLSITRTFTSAKRAEPVWDGRVYLDGNRLFVGGYSSDYNERPVGEIDSRGRFIPVSKEGYTEVFPLLQIPVDQLVFDPFTTRLFRISQDQGDLIEEQHRNYLPLTIYGQFSGEPVNLQYALKNVNGSLVLFGIVRDDSIEIARCCISGAEIISKTNAYRPELGEGCTQPGDNPVITLTFMGQLSEHIRQTEGSLCLGSEISAKTACASTDSHVDKREITIDGSFDDWRNIIGIADAAGDFVSYLYPNPDTDILEFKVNHDENYLYFYSRVAGAHGRTGGKGRYYWYTYIDVDSDPGTGYPPTRDDNCYFGISVGDDCEAQFEFVGNRFVKTFFGFTGIGAEKEVLEGKLTLGPSYYSATDSEGERRENYKVEYVNRQGKRLITHDYTEGTSEDIVIALSPDGSEVEMRVELAGFLTDQHGNMIMPPGNRIDIAVGAEAASDYYGSDRWGADSSPIIYGYELK